MGQPLLATSVHVPEHLSDDTEVPDTGERSLTAAFSSLPCGLAVEVTRVFVYTMSIRVFCNVWDVVCMSRCRLRFDTYVKVSVVVVDVIYMSPPQARY